MIQESSQIAKELISWEIWSNVFIAILFLSLSVFFFNIVSGISKEIDDNNTTKNKEDSLRVMTFLTIIAIIFSVISFISIYDLIRAMVAPHTILQNHHITEQKNDKS